MPFDMTEPDRRGRASPEATAPLWLVIDMGHLARRVFHTKPGLSDDAGNATGVTYGVLRSVRRLHQRFQPAGTLFCFDDKRTNLLRRKLFPGYKANRDLKELEWDEDEKRAMFGMHRQVKMLRDKILPFVGFRNVHMAPGYEADDLIAAGCGRLVKRGRQCLVVGSDKDLYQLLTLPGVQLFVPQHGNKGQEKFVTAETFKAEWGVDPNVWSGVKAIAGCATDNVPGVKGVAEKTACRYYAGQTDKIRADVLAAVKQFAGSPQMAINLRMVQLPYPGCPSFPAKQDRVTQDKWQAAARKLGFKSLLHFDKGG